MEYHVYVVKGALLTSYVASAEAPSMRCLSSSLTWTEDGLPTAIIVIVMWRAVEARQGEGRRRQGKEMEWRKRRSMRTTKRKMEGGRDEFMRIRCL